MTERDLRGAGRDPFVTTDWSAVLTAADAASPRACAALGALYRAYHYPLYVYVRRRGYGPHDAQDLLHDFFAILIEKNYLKSVVRERGRFRAFLLGALKHFLANDWHRANREKRGGAFTFVSLEELMGDAECRFQVAATESVAPESQFDREWARTLLSRVLSELRREAELSGRGAQFEVLKVFLSAPGSAEAYGKAAIELGSTARAMKVAVHRLRQRFQEALRREIGHTVGPVGEIEEELRHLAMVLRLDS
jgi:DNA-directed RNA polymerase specialized sigma24 family protein